jgi:acylphosphatase
MVVKRVRLLLKGRVQGITFRHFARQNAGKLGIVGYAKNLRNGDFEVVAQGEENRLEEFVNMCRRGPMLAKIESFEVSAQDPGEDDEFEYFDIRYD